MMCFDIKDNNREPMSFDTSRELVLVFKTLRSCCLPLERWHVSQVQCFEKAMALCHLLLDT
jgi:hypothetical protein